MSVLSFFRQLMYPREFRINFLPWPSELIPLLQNFIESSKNTQTTILDKLELNMFADMGTGLWRMQQKMVKPGSKQPLDEMRRPYRHFESVWDAFHQAGFEIQDHTDKPFDPGISIKVIAYQPVPGLTRERIIETIKPSIYFKDKMIQMGEVIVGRPEK